MSAEDCFVDGAPGPEERYRRAEFRQKLQDASESLSATIRGAFRLVVLKGFSTREAARELGVSKGTIKARLFQARRQMIAMLGGATGPKDAKSPRVRTRPRHVNARAVVLQTEAASARL